MTARTPAIAAALALAIAPAAAPAATPRAGTYAGRLGAKTLTVVVKGGKGTVRLKCKAGSRTQTIGTAAIAGGRLTIRRLVGASFVAVDLRVAWTSSRRARATLDGVVCDGQHAAGTLTRR